jgi:hypothetical protein
MSHLALPPLRRRVSFEPNRLAADLTRAAYDQVVPTHRRALADPSTSPAPDRAAMPRPVTTSGANR